MVINTLGKIQQDRGMPGAGMLVGWEQQRPHGTSTELPVGETLFIKKSYLLLLNASFEKILNYS